MYKRLFPFLVFFFKKRKTGGRKFVHAPPSVCNIEVYDMLPLFILIDNYGLMIGACTLKGTESSG